MPTFAATQAGYTAMWAKAQIAPAHVAAAKALAARIIANKAVYQEIEAQTGVPWFMIGVIHLRESSLDLTTYLGNGDPLSRKTTDVPAGRGPFATFVLGAIDALVYQGYTTIKGWTGPHVLYACEEFNGWGYVKHNENSPYLWGWTTLQQAGKYTRDGVFDPNVMDTQPGCVAVLKAICMVDASVNAFMNPAASAPPQPKDIPVTTPVQLPTLNIDWNSLLSAVENELPKILSAVPALAPFKDLILSVAKVFLHTDPGSVAGAALGVFINQGLPIIATFVPELAPFVGVISTVARLLLNVMPPPTAKVAAPLTPVQAAQTAPN